MAAALLSRRVAGLDPPVTVRSVGLLGGGRPSPAEVVDAVSPYGADLSGHRSTQLSPDAVESADLVVGMARRHAREVVLSVPDAWNRTFTLKELVRRGQKVGARVAGEPLDGWLVRVHTARDKRQLLGRSPHDDVDDPIGGPRSAYEATARELDGLVQELTHLLWPRPA
jgi:protein-tyrosine-phosphatase